MSAPSVIVTDNGDGTLTILNATVVDQGDGTELITGCTVTDNHDGTITITVAATGLVTPADRTYVITATARLVTIPARASDRVLTIPATDRTVTA